MALEQVMYVDNGKIIGGGGGSSEDYVDIEWEDWSELTEEQKEAGKYYIHNAPESKQKIVTDSGTFEDASQNTYTGVTTDMISYDPTNNQLLLKVGGADSVIPFKRVDDKPTLLWTNPAPTSAFAAQTVALDLSPYKSVCVEYRVSTGNSITSLAFYAVGDTVTVRDTYTAIKGASFGKAAAMSSMTRNLTITTTGINFGTGYNGVNGASTERALPLRIWGIKAQIYPSSV